MGREWKSPSQCGKRWYECDGALDNLDRREIATAIGVKP